MERDIILHGGVHKRTRVDNVAYITLFKELKGVVTFLNARDFGYGNTEGSYRLGGFGGGVKLYPQVVKLFSQ